MTQEKRNSIAGILVAIGMLIMVVMIILPLLPSMSEDSAWMERMRWAFAAGAFIVFLGRAMSVYDGPVLRIKRLYRLLVGSALLYCASAATMFISRGTNDWIAFLLAGLVMQIYASWMIDYENKKAEK